MVTGEIIYGNLRNHTYLIKLVKEGEVLVTILVSTLVPQWHASGLPRELLKKNRG
jgi:hypothetical protein